MSALENNYDIWEPASRLRPVLNIAKSIEVCTRAEVCQPSCRSYCLDCESHLVQDTGSNMLAEDRLATLFGYCAIEPSISDAFRTAVWRHNTQVPLSKDICLQDGLGPTLLRALVGNESSMFATVVQCAFLCSVCLHSPREIRTILACHWTLLSSPYPLTMRGGHDVFVIWTSCKDLERYLLRTHFFRPHIQALIQADA